MIRVAIIDDHAIVRMGLKYSLSLEPDFEFAGEHSGGEGAGEFVARVRPDVVLLDVRMPVVNGIEALEDIRRKAPDVKVLMLTTSDGDEDVFRSMNKGARGYTTTGRSARRCRSAKSRSSVLSRRGSPTTSWRRGFIFPQIQSRCIFVMSTRSLALSLASKPLPRRCALALSKLRSPSRSDGPPKGTNQQEGHRSAMDIMPCNPNGWFPLAGKSCIIDDIRTEKPK